MSIPVNEPRLAFLMSGCLPVEKTVNNSPRRYTPLFVICGEKVEVVNENKDLSGDLFILVYSITSRESFEEVTKLCNQIIECKSQCKTGSTRQPWNTPILLVGNKCDKEKDRVIDQSEALALAAGQAVCDVLETSAKKDINVNQIFTRLFELAKLPTEMSPALHRKVTPGYVGGSGSSNGKRGVSIRRKLSDACGAIAPNVRRPSIRTDLLVAQTRTNQSKLSCVIGRDSKCVIQ